MILAEWLTYLESLNPNKIELGLERVNKVANTLQLRHFQCPVVTVAGTNGKGSSVAFLEQIYLTNNYRVGAYTSPHLFTFNERIRLQGVAVDDANLCAAFEIIYQASKNTPLTYFEFTTLAALIIFKNAKLDLLILEVGLGGRLDAVNCVDADVALISTVALDHTEWLGHTREAIGREKAGIFRANRPAVYGEADIPLSVIDVATQLKVDLYSLNRDYNYSVSNDKWTWHSRTTILAELPLPKLALQNAAAALMVVELLQPRLLVAHENIKHGLVQANLPGRFQRRLVQQIEHIIDVAHNPAAGAWLAQQLAALPPAPTYAVVGMLADKDIASTLQPLSSLIAAWYVGDLPTTRSASARQLITVLQQQGITECYSFTTINSAYEAGLARCKPPTRLLIFGSFYTAAVVMANKNWVD